MEQTLPGITLKKHQVFKEYDTNKIDYLYFKNVGKLIPNNHIARLINILVDNMDLTKIFNKYKGGGTSAYNPCMLLKVWLLGYIEKIYTSRKLEKVIKENIVFMWISGLQTPDFRTLNNFRNILEDEIKNIFKTTVKTSMSLGLIDGKIGNIDGTIINANTNKHKVIWKKSIEKGLEKIENELSELTDNIFKESKELQLEEDNKYENNNLENNNLKKSVKIEEVLKIVKNVENKLKNKRNKTKEEKKIFKDSKRIKKLTNRKIIYKEKQKKLAGKNSCAIHDNDANAVYNKQGIIRPGYTELIVSQNQIVLNYETDNKNEKILLKEAIENVEKNTEIKLEKIVGDGGFGSEENYKYLKEKEILGYIKHNRYYKKKNKKWTQEKVRKENFKKLNNEEYLCPSGKILKFKEINERKTKTGYIIKQKIYQAQETDCTICPFKTYCTKAKFRTITISDEYENLKLEAEKILKTKEGRKLSKMRGCDVETIFAYRKSISDRFLLKRLNKVRIESGIYYSINNIKKIYKFLINNWLKFKQESGILLLTTK